MLRDSVFLKHEIYLQELHSQFPLFFEWQGLEAQTRGRAEVRAGPAEETGEGSDRIVEETGEDQAPSQGGRPENIRCEQRPVEAADLAARVEAELSKAHSNSGFHVVGQR